MVEYIVAIDVTRVRFPADAIISLFAASSVIRLAVVLISHLLPGHLPMASPAELGVANAGPHMRQQRGLGAFARVRSNVGAGSCAA